MRRRTQLGLIAFALAVGLQSSAGAPVPAGLLDSFTWRMEDSRLGGMSGIVVDRDGLQFIAVSDRRTFFQGTFQRDSDGRINGVADVSITSVKGRDGTRLRGQIIDSEGLARGLDGQLWVALEGPAHIARFRSPSAGGRLVEVPREFMALPHNASLESIAIDAAGHLYTIPEDTTDGQSDFPVWRRDDAGWSVIGTIPRHGGFLVSDAAFGPDGRLYVLERGFHGFFGFQSRLSRFSLDSGVGPQEVMLTSAVGQHDNLEGLAVWQDDDGLIATMISDDNFRFFQRTEIVEYRLPD